jgi:hypothetical protein
LQDPSLLSLWSQQEQQQGQVLQVPQVLQRVHLQEQVR